MKIKYENKIFKIYQILKYLKWKYKKYEISNQYRKIN